MLELLFQEPLSFLYLGISLLIAITIHEFSHAYIADRMGDPTPRLNGRVTLNPLAHLDPVGTLALLIVQFGWGKPVPVDPYNLQDPKKDNALISLAGPASNLILAGLLAVFIKFTHLIPLTAFWYILIIINVNLAIFNLLPIPPLDGSKILLWLLPSETAYELEDNLNRYGTMLLLFILFPWIAGNSIASMVISPIIGFILKILL